MNLTKHVSNVVKNYPALRQYRHDIIQESFLVISTGTACYDPAKSVQSKGPLGAFYAWVNGVVHNVARKTLRQLRSTQSDTGFFPILASKEKSPACDQTECTFEELEKRGLKVLTDPVDREIFLRHFVHGNAVDTIAEVVGVKAMAVYQRIHRMRQKLRDSHSFDEFVD